jgi:hypothetical protein
VENAIYGAAAGIAESPVVAMTTDEAQNRWVATPRALYLLRPGETSFRRLDEVDGLHLGAITGRSPGPVGWAKYCNMAPIPDDGPCNSGLVWGGASSEGIKTIVGGGPNEVFIGYDGDQTRGADGEPIPCTDADDPVGWKGFDYCDPLRHSGKVDWVRLNADGTLTVVRFDLLSNQYGAKYWHDRTISRLAYDHFVHKGTLYTGANHGVSILFPAKYREPMPGEWFDLAYSEYMGDHQHSRVCFHEVCSPDGESASMRVGQWLTSRSTARAALARWQVDGGRITWVDDALQWHKRYGAAFDATFGDPWIGGAGTSPPVFDVSDSGDPVYLTAVSVCPDGRVWFASRGPTTGNAAARGRRSRPGTAGASATTPPPRWASPRRGVRSRVPARRTTRHRRLHDRPVDLRPRDRRREADPRVLRPHPSDRVNQLEVDRMVDPPALTSRRNPARRCCARCRRGSASRARSRPWPRARPSHPDAPAADWPTLAHRGTRAHRSRAGGSRCAFPCGSRSRGWSASRPA